MRERIVALRQLKRMSEARRVVEQYLKADPEQSGPVMIRLLEAMHAEIETADDRGDQQAVREVASEAAELARSLMEWSDARPSRLPPRDRLTIAVWCAAATLHAGRPDESVKLFDACSSLAVSVPDEHKLQDIEIRLGRAESLLAAGEAADALSIFALLGKELSEESPAWWRAFAGQLQCHAALGHDSAGILRAISHAAISHLIWADPACDGSWRLSKKQPLPPSGLGADTLIRLRCPPMMTNPGGWTMLTRAVLIVMSVLPLSVFAAETPKAGAAGATTKPIAGKHYEPTWESLKQYTVPHWYMDAKFGIFIHWGVYRCRPSVTSGIRAHVPAGISPSSSITSRTCGPQRQFGYKDFIPMFKAEKCDPDAVGRLFQRAGAKYVVPGCRAPRRLPDVRLQLSPIGRAAKMGPKRDIVGELAKAVREQGLMFGVSQPSRRALVVL